MIPKYVKRKDNTYEFVKEYKSFVLYEEVNTKVKECFTKFQLGILEEQIKPEKHANKGGIVKC